VYLIQRFIVYRHLRDFPYSIRRFLAKKIRTFFPVNDEKELTALLEKHTKQGKGRYAKEKCSVESRYHLFVPSKYEAFQIRKEVIAILSLNNPRMKGHVISHALMKCLDNPL